MDAWSLAERNILPADTAIAKKIFGDGRNTPVHVTVVLSGKEQKSIHRPQKCLPAQGYAIERSHVMPVTIPERADLVVTVLELRGAGTIEHAAPSSSMPIGLSAETVRHPITRNVWSGWRGIIFIIVSGSSGRMCRFQSKRPMTSLCPAAAWRASSRNSIPSSRPEHLIGIRHHTC